MTYKCALLCIHGMGNLKKEGFQLDIAKLKQNISVRLPISRLSEIYIPNSGVFYSSITQGQEDKAWNAMETMGGLNTGVLRRNITNRIRRFIISGFSDATAFTGLNSATAMQKYMDVQYEMYKALGKVRISHQTQKNAYVSD